MVARSTERRTPKGHHGIADELVEHALVGVNGVGDQREVAIQQANQASRREVFADPGETDQVAKADRHHALAAFGFGRVGIQNYLFDDAGIDVLSEGLLHVLLGAQLIHQLIEGTGEHADFVGAADWNLNAEVTLFDGAHAAHQDFDGVHHAARSQPRKHQAEQNRERGCADGDRHQGLFTLAGGSGRARDEIADARAHLLTAIFQILLQRVVETQKLIGQGAFLRTVVLEDALLHAGHQRGVARDLVEQSMNARDLTGVRTIRWIRFDQGAGAVDIAVELVVLIGVLGGYILQFLAGVGPHRSDQAQPVLEGDAASEPVVVHLTQNLVQRDVEVGDALLFRVQFVGLQSAESRESDCEREQ